MAYARRSGPGTWSGRYRDALGNLRTATGGPWTHKAAALRAATIQEAKARRRAWESHDRRLTWGEWCEDWLTTRTVEASTARVDQHFIDKHIAPKWNKARLNAISPHDVQEWVTQLITGTAGTSSRPLKPKSASRILNVFSASLTAATRAGHIDVSPATNITVGGGVEDNERFLTKDEVARVANELDQTRALAVYTLAYCGLRFGEFVALDDADFDRQRNVVRVHKTWMRSERRIKPYPKGKKPRTVPVPAWLIENIPRNIPAFAGPKGGRIDVKAFRSALTTATRAAGVAPFRIHDLRHTYASWLVQGGVPLVEVARLLGHRSVVTSQRYAHLTETVPDSVLRALD